MEQIKEDCRDARPWRWLNASRQDLEYAVRILRHTAALTAAIVGSLALGIGANTAMFSVINGLLLKTLPVGR